VNYYRKLHGRETLSSSLQQIQGMGKKRTLSLLRHFGSLARVREASLEDLVGAPAMNRTVASRVYQTMHREESQGR
jgi:excinuclease ABC subunit C